MTLSLDTLLSTPIPPDLTVDPDLVAALQAGEQDNLVVKMNAGKPNQNIKHDPALLNRLNMHLFGPVRGAELGRLSQNSDLPLLDD